MKIKDDDLAFLSGADNEDLQILVDYITKNKSGNARWTEQLTSTDAYKRYYPDNLRFMADDIAHELQLFGGNTVANLVRGHGVPYREILMDVCKKMKVNFNKNSAVDVIEFNLLSKILMDSLEKMEDEDLKQLIQELNIGTIGAKVFRKEAAIAAIQMLIRRGGFNSYKIAVIIANRIAKLILGHGLKLSANAALTRWMAIFAGPVGWWFTGLWTAYDLAGPAYRVTIPAVIQIAYMRTKLKMIPENL